MDTRIAYRTATEEFSQALHLNIHKSNFIKRATTIMLDLLKKGNHITKIDRALKNAAIKSKHRQKIEKWGSPGVETRAFGAKGASGNY